MSQDFDRRTAVVEEGGMSKVKKYDLIEEKTEPYTVLAEARELWHTDLDDAAIALAWERKIRADTDGHVRLGKCVRVTELYREFSDFNFIIVLNREVWESPEFGRERKLALIDHELCHAAPALDDDTGEQKRDAAERLIWRIRKHDIEEFRSVVSHHGCYKRDLEMFAEALLRKNSPSLFTNEAEERKAVQ
jgi:Putative phage metallopeptidase